MIRSRDRRRVTVPAALAVLLAAIAASCTEPTAPTRVTAHQLQLRVPAGLLACASGTRESASVVIGPEGGTLATAQASLAIPAGAVPSPTRFTIVLPQSPLVEVSITAEGEEHYRFAAPVSVSISYARCGLVTRTLSSLLGVWYIDDVTKGFLEAMPATDDRLRSTVTFTTDHLSSYAVAY